MRRTALLLVVGLVVAGCAGGASDPSTAGQLRDAIEQDLRDQEDAVKELGNLPHVGRCDGPRDGGAGTYYCRADDGQSLEVRVDAQGRWSTTVRVTGRTNSDDRVKAQGEGLQLRD